MNIFKKLPPKEGEIFETLLEQNNVIIKHIISSSKLQNTTYMQDEDEFVIIIKGEALLEIECEQTLLKSGEYIFIKAYTKHKILKTKKNTHWITVFIKTL